jgi:purine-binding chemotaxis protein CheW
MALEQQYVIFELSDEDYGLEIASVESIIKLQPITSVPHAPDFVEGVTNLRGRVLPVIDLRKRFNVKVDPERNQERGKETRIIVMIMNGTMLGMIVDAVSEVLRVSEEAIEPLPDMTTTINEGFITGVAKLEERLVILLDLEKLMTPQQKEKLKMIAEAA